MDMKYNIYKSGRKLILGSINNQHFDYSLIINLTVSQAQHKNTQNHNINKYCGCHHLEY